MIIPDDMIEASGLIFTGEYDVKNYAKEDPSILDIGANIGAFSRWATYRWPGCSINAYEPVKISYSYLVENTKENSKIKTHNAAVGAKNERKLIYYGFLNSGECSFTKGDQQRDYGEEVDVIAAESLDYADIVKIDTEGSELEIIANLKFKPHLFLLEYHSIPHRTAIIDYLDDYTLIEYVMMNKKAGSIKLVRNDIM